MEQLFFVQPEGITELLFGSALEYIIGSEQPLVYRHHFRRFRNLSGMQIFDGRNEPVVDFGDLRGMGLYLQYLAVALPYIGFHSELSTAQRFGEKWFDGVEFREEKIVSDAESDRLINGSSSILVKKI